MINWIKNHRFNVRQILLGTAIHMVSMNVYDSYPDLNVGFSSIQDNISSPSPNAWSSLKSWES